MTEQKTTAATEATSSSNVWKELGTEYFDLTHLHGFKELSISEKLLEKIFWLSVIFGAFAFTGYLIYLSVQDYNDDKKQTFVQQNRYGNISLPVLYCPSHWIDLAKVERENVPNEHLLYALSYLRTNRKTYFDDSSFKGNGYLVDVSPGAFCNDSNPEPVHLPEFVYMAPFIENKCLQDSGGPPPFYKERSLKLIKRNIMGIVATNNVVLMKTIFEKCLEGKVDEVWKILYERFYLSTSVYHRLRNLFSEPSQIKKFKACGRDKFSAFITLKDIDNFNISGEHSCSKQNYTDIVTNTSLCGVYNHLAMYYMFNGDVRRSYSCDDCSRHLELEQYRSRKFAQLLPETNPEYAGFLSKSNFNNSFESFRKFIHKHIGGSDYHQNKKFVEMQGIVNKQFKANEKKDFEDNFLKNNSIFDIFKNVALDKSRFLLSMSIDPVFEIRPISGSITVEMVTNSYGICYLFQINADMTPLAELPYVINEVDQWRRVNQKLYVNIVELSVGTPLLVRTDDNIIVFGTSAYDLVPSKNWFKTLEAREIHYNQFQISNLAYQNRLGFEECQERSKAGNDVTYTYNNCLMNCFSKYTQPKFIGGNVKKPSYCEYIMENFMGDKAKSPCSFFSEANKVSSMQVNPSKLDEGLEECQQGCRTDCETINFNIKAEIAECGKDNYCQQLDRFKDFDAYEDPSLVIKEYYVNLPDRNHTNVNHPIWMKQFEEADDPTVVEMIYGIKHALAQPVSRIEIQIDSDVTTYITSQSLVWYSYLGVVGGQINLIVSGSVITLFQLIWWISRYFYKGVLASRENGTNCGKPAYWKNMGRFFGKKFFRKKV